MRWAVYIVQCGDGSFYTGATNNIARRLCQHREELAGGAKYTRGRQPITLAFYREYNSQTKALQAEAEIKALDRTNKRHLIWSSRMDDLEERRRMEVAIDSYLQSPRADVRALAEEAKIFIGRKNYERVSELLAEAAAKVSVPLVDAVKQLAKCDVTKARRLIEAGKVSVDGRRVRTLRKDTSQAKTITIDEQTYTLSSEEKA